MEAAHYEQTALWGRDHVFTPEHQIPKFEAVRHLLPSPPPGCLVDVGAGDGRLIDHLAAHGYEGRTVAAERSMAALQFAGGATQRAQASIDALPFRDASFPVVVCCEVLEHLPPDVYARARRELARIARDHVIVTVPNRERRARADITCASCGCRYNPDRHLRSFARQDLDALVPGFDVTDVLETGPRQPVYPRWARLALERAKVLTRPGSPTCPQCGARYRYASGPTSPVPSEPDSPHGARRGYDLARRLAPKARHPYYLCARFTRRA